ncbi:MAG: YgiQ family radical SAM protein [Bacteroidales bacterium]|nr:YgiQ family radical SAM protein [Bacteroidales bacterium]
MDHFLPITQKEFQQLGWTEADVILISGDAYVDHPSFCTAVIGRTLERQGLKVAILPQPNWRDDLRDFKKLGKPRLFFGITAGNMDSMVNHYTANRRLRSDDAYTPGGKASFRPDYATVVYSKIVRSLYPDVPIVIGGVEASMRRLSHYDYWSDTLKPSILVDSGADALIYGMGERPIVELAKAFEAGEWRDRRSEIPQIAYLDKFDNQDVKNKDMLLLHAYEKELKDKRLYGENFVAFEKETNKKQQRTMIQPYGDRCVVVNPPFPPVTTEEMDQQALFGDMMYRPHPKYDKRGEVPAFEMIKNSINIHRGCFGGCSFCAIAAHQGKFICSRSEQSVLAEVEHLVHQPYFKGHISDLGGPSANMYKMGGRDERLCQRCTRPSCIFPSVCRNLQFSHKPITALYKKASQIAGVKQITIGSGIRYDLLLNDDPAVDRQNGLTDYLRQVVNHHVSGRLKVAPEHTEAAVLDKMRKPHFDRFMLFLRKFNEMNRQSGKNQQLIPYFISSHPGCSLTDMGRLAVEAKKCHLQTDQVQDFTPTPMTYSTAMYYLGYDPYTMEKVEVARKIDDKKAQHLLFFYHHKENKELICKLLRQRGEVGLIRQLYPQNNYRPSQPRKR